MLAVGSLLTAGGFALWLLVPSFAGFAVGFVLWGIGGALASGTWEALVYDSLTVLDVPDRYAGLIGAGESAGWLAAVASAAVTAPLLSVGGYALVGWSSVALATAHAALCLALPDPPRTGVDPEELDEDGELDDGDGEPTVPLLMTLTFLAQAVAAALADPAARLDPRWTPRLLGAGAVLIAAGAITAHPVGFAAVAVGYGIGTCTLIVVDARLQESITGPARATITSTVGLGSELVAVALFAGYATGSLVAPITALVAINAVALLASARSLPHP
ncbi:hypothetical protein BH23ACT9_BH23ACT9_09650 [soil metagenome]